MSSVYIHNYYIHYFRLLQESLLFVGMGAPYEGKRGRTERDHVKFLFKMPLWSANIQLSFYYYKGPGPLEAIANGCAFIQPKISPPINKHNNVSTILSVIFLMQVPTTLSNNLKMYACIV